MPMLGVRGSAFDLAQRPFEESGQAACHVQTDERIAEHARAIDRRMLLERDEHRWASREVALAQPHRFRSIILSEYSTSTGTATAMFRPMKPSWNIRVRSTGGCFSREIALAPT